MADQPHVQHANQLPRQPASLLPLCTCNSPDGCITIMLITSKNNDLVKLARSVRDGHTRELIFIEGTRLCEESIKANLIIQTVISFVADELSVRSQSVLQELIKLANRVAFVSYSVFKSISDLEVPQGIIVLAQTPELNQFDISFHRECPPLVLVLHKINNPHNAGALLRTAEAAGATGIIATKGTTSLLSCKALRGSMGAAFRLPIWARADFVEVVRWCHAHGLQIVCSDISAEANHWAIDWKRPTALIMGAEAHGLDRSEVVLTDAQYRIPMTFVVESLNVAVAAGISLYEAVRQRNSPANTKTG